MAITGIVVSVMGISGRAFQAAERGDAEYLQSALIAAFIDAGIIMLGFAVIFGSFRPGQDCARLIRRRFPDDLVVAAHINRTFVKDAIRGLDRSKLGPGDHRPPGVNFAVRANERGVSFWAGIREPRMFLELPWVTVESVHVDQISDKWNATLNIDVLDVKDPLALSVSTKSWLGFSLLNLNELESLAQTLDELRLDSNSSQLPNDASPASSE